MARGGFTANGQTALLRLCQRAQAGVFLVERNAKDYSPEVQGHDSEVGNRVEGPKVMEVIPDDQQYERGDADQANHDGEDPVEA